MFNCDNVLTPSIFEGVSRVKSVFTQVGERNEENPLGNNMTVVPATIREGLTSADIPEDELDEATRLEIQRVHARRNELDRYIGIRSPFKTASPKPVAGADFVDLSLRTIDYLQLDSPNRISADVVHLIAPGYASVYAPADCPVIDIVDPNTGGQVVQVHAGWQGILAGVVVQTMQRMIARGLCCKYALANVHPNATTGFELGGDGLERWQSAFGGDFMEVIDGKSYISMTDAVVAQMIDVGVQPGRIQTSSQYSADGNDLNSLTDDRFYSHRTKAQKGFNGRNAAVLHLVDY